VGISPEIFIVAPSTTLVIMAIKSWALVTVTPFTFDPTLSLPTPNNSTVLPMSALVKMLLEQVTVVEFPTVLTQIWAQSPWAPKSATFNEVCAWLLISNPAKEQQASRIKQFLSKHCII
jgi:hypothetical protein